MTSAQLMAIAFRTTVAGALFVGAASLAIAQQVKPPKGPPRTTTGTMKSSPKAEQGQATAEAKRAEARERKAVKNIDRLQNKEQRSALAAARSEPKALLKGLTLSTAARAHLLVTRKQYVGDLRDLESQARIAEKAGQADPSVVARIEELRRRERAEMRAALTVPQQVRFDRNAERYGIKKY